MEFIELNRSFVRITKDAEPNLLIGRMWGRRIGGWLEWSDLLERKRVVLLAEADSGKSKEFENAVAALRRRNERAFYFTIEQLTNGPPSAGLDSASAAMLLNWRGSTEPAWFFLDSVDEARLNRKRFEDALRSLSRELGPMLHHARVLVSCRASDWRGHADRSAFLSILPIDSEPQPAAKPTEPDAALLDPIFKERETPKEKADTTEPLVVQLIPLSSEDQRTLAAACRVGNPNDFVDAVYRMGLEALGERPGDLIELADYWRAHDRFGTLAEMTEYGVTRKLAETDKYRPDNRDLTQDKARAGAERIAAALTLGKSFTLRAPAQEADPELAEGALDPGAILSEWTEAEINALVRRGIFTPSTYGRVRFHHRGTQEYLTGAWLHRLLTAGCPLSAISGLIFADRYGVETVVPSLRAAAAWLSLKSPEIRAAVIRREPMMLMQHGDPSSLPIETKRHLLLHVAKEHAAGNIANDSVDNRALWMFASPELADAVHAAWNQNPRQDFRFDLLRIIREGKIAACTDLARSAALDKSANDHHRSVAVAAIAACDDQKTLAALARAVVKKPSDLRARVAAQLALALFPRHLSVPQLLELIDKSSPPVSDSSGGFSEVISDLWKACPAPDREAFMSGLADLCLRPPFRHDYQRVSARHFGLATYLAPVARGALSVLAAGQEPPESLTQILAVIERADRPTHRDDDDPPLAQLVRSNKPVQRRLLWHDVADVRSREKTVTEFWAASIIGGSVLWDISADDLPWLYEDLQARALIDDRRVSLSGIVQILRREKKLARKADSLRKLVKGVPELAADLEAALRLRPPRASRRFDRERISKRSQEQRQKGQASWLKFRDDLLSNPSQLADRVALASSNGWLPLFNLTKWLRNRTQCDEENAALQWPLLAEAFSQQVAEAYRDGMCLLWRLVDPEPPEREPGGPVNTKWVTILAYAGIGIEASSSRDWSVRLGEADAKRAALHGCLSGQGAPEWIVKLAADYPAAVMPILSDALQAEWDSKGGHAPFFYRLGTEANLDPSLGRIVVQVICDREPNQLYAFDYALRALSRLELDADERVKLKKVALQGLAKYRASEITRAIRYVALLFVIDPAVAVASLGKWLRGTPASGRRFVAEQVIGGLFGRHDPVIPAPLKETPVPLLIELVRLTYESVKPSDDNVHEGSYSPDTRDEAEHGRGAVLTALINRGGPEAYEGIMGLSRSRAVQKSNLRFRELARGMAERDTEPDAWTAAEVGSFENSYLLPVKSADDLYRVVLGVLDEIIWSFDHEDATSRAVLETARSEDAVQEWLHEALHLRSKGRYHVHRETEVAEGNKPDIVVSATTAAFEIAIEVKHGDKGWTVTTLEHALTEQLAEDYLRPVTRRHGVLVVTRHRKKTWRSDKGGPTLNFRELMSRLAAQVARLRRNRVGPIKVSVRGIDAAPRIRRRGSLPPAAERRDK